MPAGVRYGDQGENVGALHQALLERGLTIGKNELEHDQFGPTTLAAVTQFQRRERLAVDGIVGAKTWAALRRAPRMSDGLYDSGWQCETARFKRDPTAPLSIVINAALSDMGLKEDPPGSNRGPVEKYDAFLDGAWQPYCAAAVCYWYRRPIPPIVPASLLSGFKWVEWARANKRLVVDNGRTVTGYEAVAQPRPGDVWICRRGRNSWRSHVELIVHVSDRLSLIGGNTSNMVRGTVRPLNSYSHLVRPL
jgi:hypothetical protein